MTNEESSAYLILNHKYFTNVKLIIGNGFDLACGLNSSYAAFFKSRAATCLKIEKWLSGTSGYKPKDMSVWDCVFILLGDYGKFKDIDSIRWKDVEKVIRLTMDFDSKADRKQTKPGISFPKIYNAIQSGKEPDESLNRTMVKVVSSIHPEPFDNEKAFYDFLLRELNQFELAFSTYVRKAMNSKYQNAAKKLMSKAHICFERTEGTKMKDELMSIDTFNYTTPDVFKKYKVRHVNGRLIEKDEDGAIFGIDSHDIESSDPRYIFTKTYRKMLQLAKGKREDFKRDFSNVAVFGHSLSEADYSYFFSIFDKMNLSDFSEHQKRLVFIMTEYNEGMEDTMSLAVLRLLEAYDKWKNPHSNRHGLAEILETSDRIGFAKISTKDLFD